MISLKNLSEQSNTTPKDFTTQMIIDKKPKKVRIYCLTIKSNSDNFRVSAIQGVITHIKAKVIVGIVYAPSLYEDKLFKSTLKTDFIKFTNECDVIIANHKLDDCVDVVEMIYIRYLLG